MADNQVVVSGAGLVGLSAAALLLEHGYEVLVVDPHAPTSNKSKFGVGLRSAALSPASMDFLESLHLDLAELRQDVRKMLVWESAGTGSISFHARDVNADCLAAIFDHDELTVRLIEMLKSRVTTRFGQTITDFDASTNTITLSTEETLTPELLIICEGSGSQTMQLVGAKTQEKPLNQHALVTLVRSRDAHDGLALQRFSPTPCAFLPLRDPTLLSVIWTLDEHRLERLKGLDTAAFLMLATDEAEGRFGKFIDLDQRVSFPLFHSLIEDFNPHPSVLVLGDSAHTLHPLAGQGVNLGLEDVARMESVLQDSSTTLNQANLWREFNHKRRMRAKTMLTLMESFSKIWQMENPYARLVRNVGVRLFDQNPLIKRQLIKEAMGLGPIGGAL